ncbi:MAG: hypothetical protein QM778_16790 [Myxococcales bacterium]
MTERIPPLKLSDEVPPELRDALRALRGEQIDPGRLARVSDKLSAVLDAPPPPPSALPSWLRFAPSKALLARVAVSAILAGSAAIWLATPAERSAPPAKPALTTSTPAQVPVTDDTTAASAPSPAELHTMADAPASPSSARDKNGATTPATAPARPQRPRSDKQHVQPHGHGTAATPASANYSGRDPSDAPSDALDARMEHEPPAAKPEPVADKPEPVAEKPEPPAQRSEVELLFEARRLIKKDPGAALRVLDEHAARFPDGMLVPEREVLAIDALRKLGREAQATRRLQAFRTRYPDSFHIGGLERAPR